MSKETAIANGMNPETYERYIDDGFNDDEIAEIWKQTLLTRQRMRENEGQEKRSEYDVTCSTYERAVKLAGKNFDGWFGRGMK